MNTSLNGTLGLVCFALALLALVGLVLVWSGGSVPGIVIGLLTFIVLIGMGIVLVRRN
jgi:hypothetical protein